MRTFEEYRDTAQGIKQAKMQKDKLYAFQRGISARVSWFFFRWFPFVQGTHVTMVSFLILAAAGVAGVSMLYGASQAVWYALAGLILLHLVNFTDMIDGELARAHNNCTQRGLFYDRAVHLIYPSVFYFLVGSFFLSLTGDVVVFALALLAGVMNLLLVQCAEGRLLIGTKIKDGNVHFVDLLAAPIPKPPRRVFIVRILDYLTFMIYSWALFLYVAFVLVSIWLPMLALWLCAAHLMLTIVANGYKVFISYPRDRLFTVSEAESLRTSSAKNHE